jgi:hypothetical protein
VPAVYNRVHRMPFGELSAVYYKHVQTARRKLTVNRRPKLQRLVKNILVSGVIVPAPSPVAEFTIKPIARQAPFVHDSARRYVERFGRLFHGQPAEEP